MTTDFYLCKNRISWYNTSLGWAGLFSRYSDSLQAEKSRDRTPFFGGGQEIFRTRPDRP